VPGGLLKLLDAYVAVGGDLSGFDRAVDESEAKARKAGDRLEQAFSPRKLLGALATGAAAGFGIMAKGGADLNQTLTEIQARSGAVGAQWDAMSEAIQRQNRRTTLSLQEIGDGVAAIKTDLGAAADEVGLASDRLTDFAAVARESFLAAVTGADDLRDAYSLTLLETFAVLDALVVSQQTFGGTLVENRAALVALAPAIRGANLGWQDALELINLFNASGVEASTIPVALQRALSQVHSPAELRRLIADIEATEDPFLRAQKAADLFGSRAGAKMANALAPGKGALEDYGVSADQAAGAVDKAARKIDSSWNRTIALAIENLTGLAAQAGNATGPILSIAGSIGSAISGISLLIPGLGPRIAAGLKTMILRITPGFIAQSAAMGTAAGTAAAAAFAVAVIAAPAAVLLTAMDQQGQIDRQAADLLRQTQEFTKVATDQELANSIKGVREQLDGMVFNSYDSKNKVVAVLNTLIAEANRRETEGVHITRRATEAIVDTTASTLTAGAGTIAAAAATAASGIPRGMAAAAAATRAAVADVLAQAANEIRSKRSAIDAAIDQLNADLKRKPISATTELERLLKARTSTSLLALLRSPDRQIRADAKALAAMLDQQIAELGPRPGIMNAYSKKLLAQLKASSNPELVAFGAWFQTEIERQAGLKATTKAELEGRLEGGLARTSPVAHASPETVSAIRQGAIDAIERAIGSKETSDKIAELFRTAETSADPLIRRDAKAAGEDFTASIADGIASPASLGSVADAVKLLLHSAVTAWNEGRDFLLLPGIVPGSGSSSGGGGHSVRILDVGMPYVPSDQLAVIHRREAVLTVEQANAWRAGMAGRGPTEQNFYIDQVTVADATDEQSVLARLRFLAAVG
jgi:hypothetical protein